MLTLKAIDQVRAFRKRKGWNLSQFARSAGLKESTIRKMDTDDWNPTVETLAKLEAAIATAKADEKRARAARAAE